MAEPTAVAHGVRDAIGSLRKRVDPAIAWAFGCVVLVLLIVVVVVLARGPRPPASGATGNGHDEGNGASEATKPKMAPADRVDD